MHSLHIVRSLKMCEGCYFFYGGIYEIKAESPEMLFYTV